MDGNNISGGTVTWDLDANASGLTSTIAEAKSEVSSYSTAVTQADHVSSNSFASIADSAESSLGSTADTISNASSSSVADLSSLSGALDDSNGYINTIQDAADNAIGPITAFGAAADGSGDAFIRAAPVLDNTTEAVDALGSSFESATRKIIAYGGLSGVIIGTAKIVEGSVSSYADFGSQLGILQTVTGATGKQLQQLSSTAVTLGDDISLPGVSASDAATAELELAKAGLSVNNVLAASRGVLSLATAGQIDVGDAADITAEALNSFGLQGSQATTVANELAAGADASTASVSDMALGLEQVGAGAHQLGITLPETISALSLFSNAGIDGERAGTDLNQMFQQISAPTKEASDEMQSLGLNFFNAKGKFIGLSSVAQELQDKFKGLTQEQQNAALAIIFGSSATRTASVLADGGSKAFDSMTKSVEKQGAAASLAAAANTGIKGSLSALVSNLQTAGLQFGAFISGGLKPIVDLANKDMPAALAAAGAAFIGVGLIILNIMNPALFTMSGALIALQGTLDLLGIGLIITAVAGLAAGIVFLQQKTDFLGKTFQTVAPFFHDVFTGLHDVGLALEGADPTVGALGPKWEAFTESLTPIERLVDRIKTGFHDVAIALHGADPTAGAVGPHWQEFTKDLQPLSQLMRDIKIGFGLIHDALSGISPDLDTLDGHWQEAAKALSPVTFALKTMHDGLDDLGKALQIITVGDLTGGIFKFNPENPAVKGFEQMHYYILAIGQYIGSQLSGIFSNFDSILHALAGDAKDVARDLKPLLDPLIDFVKDHKTDILDFFKGFAIILGGLVVAPVAIAVGVLLGVLTGLRIALEFVNYGLGILKQWFKDAKGFIGDLVSGALKDLGQWYKNVKGWIKDVSDAYDHNAGELKVIADTIGIILLPAFGKLVIQSGITGVQVAANGVIAAAGWIVDKVQDVWGWGSQLASTLANALTQGPKIAAQGVIAAAGWIINKIKDAWGWVAQLALTLLDAAKYAIKIAAQGVIAAAGWIADGWGWAGSLIKVVASATIAAVQIAAEGTVAAAPWIAGAAAAALAWVIAAGPIVIVVGAIVLAVAAAVGLIIKYWSNITGAFDNVVSYFRNVGPKIINAIGDLGSLLYNAGASIISGLLKGITDRFNDVKSFVSGIASWISNHKGPLDYDRQLLVPHGNAIISGLQQGMSDQFSKTQSWVSTLAPKLSASFAGTPSSNTTDLDTSIAPTIATGLVTPSSGVANAQPQVTVHLHMDGVISRSRAEFRDIMNDGVAAVNEGLRARNLPLIANGQVSGRSTAA